MKKLLTIGLILAIGLPSMAQVPEVSKKEQRKILREERKKAKQKEEERIAFLMDYMITHGRFVLEANTMSNRKGETWNVQSTLNFIASDSTMGVLQVGNNNRLGSNGLGGFTVNGKIVNYRYTKNEKRGTYTADYTLHSPVGVYTVNLSAGKTGWANATVSGTMSRTVVYEGNLKLPQESLVYKGYDQYK